MTEREIDVQQELLQQAKRQTYLLSQINTVLWVLTAASLIACLLLVIR